ncbi:MAG: LUD domain-containing protein [Anaerolineaceae bacterium]|nr:LUD domain-containing protein [Anaerolineaceae bacterium]
MNNDKLINQPAQQPPNETYAKLASDAQVEKTAAALTANGMEAFIAENGDAAKAKLFELIPDGAEVFTATSRTLDSLGIEEEVAKRFNSIRSQLAKMDQQTQMREMVKLGATPQVMVGSVHAITESGAVVIASNTGSQLAGYVAGAAQVIWVVSTKKIVPDLEEAVKRIYEYTYPLEDLRAQKAYGGMHSNISKMLFVGREIMPGRTKVILVKEDLGY